MGIAVGDIDESSQIPGYDELTLIGHGAHGPTFRAYHQQSGRWVAVKVLSGGLVDPESRQQFLRGSNAASRLSTHPNIVAVYDAGITPSGRPFVATELFPEGSLEDALRASGPFQVGHALRIGVLLAGALETVHRAGLLHRNVHPANILLTSGQPVLSGLGLPPATEPRNPGSTGVGGTRSVRIGAAQGDAGAGAPRYAETATTGPPSPFAGPETRPGSNGGAEVTPAADVYSLAATVYAMLAGRAPFEGEQQDVAPIDRPDVPDLLMVALTGALLTDPALRPSSAVAFARTVQDVQRILRHEVVDPIVVHLPPAADPVPEPPESSKIGPSTVPPPPPDPCPPLDAIPPPPADPPGSPAAATLDNYWPESVPEMGPPAGAATSPAWVEAPAVPPDSPEPPPPSPVESPAPGIAPSASPPRTPAAPTDAPPLPPNPAPSALSPPPPGPPSPAPSQTSTSLPPGYPTAAPGGPPPAAPTVPCPAPSRTSTDLPPGHPDAPALPPSVPPGYPTAAAPAAARPEAAPTPSGAAAGWPFVLLGVLVLAGVAIGAALMLSGRSEDEDAGDDDVGSATVDPTTTTAELEVPTGLTAAESEAGAQLDWEGDDAARYAVLVLSDVSPPRVVPAESGTSFLVPITDLVPEAGYCFAVAYLDTVTDTPDTSTESAFSPPTCIRGASEDTVLRQ